jgi:DNA-binding NarL/FixJ family response regulator
MAHSLDGADSFKLKLMVVDDHRRAREALVRRLAGHPRAAVAGHTDDMLEAHGMLAAHRPHVALIDPRRADGLGPRVVASFAALPPTLRPLVIVHVAYFNPDDWRNARAAGADDLLLKHIGVEPLVSGLLAIARASLPRERWPGVLED